MKVAIALSLLAIGFLIYWNWQRVVQRYKPISARSAEHGRIDQLMGRFGDRRKQLAEIKEIYAARFGRAADLDAGWTQVTRSVELSCDNLNSFKFDLAVHFMEEAVRFATEILERRGIAAGDSAGLEETRRCVQDALNRRG